MKNEKFSFFFNTPEKYHRAAFESIKEKVYILKELKEHKVLYFVKTTENSGMHVPEGYFTASTLSKKIKMKLQDGKFSESAHGNEAYSGTFVISMNYRWWLRVAAVVLLILGAYYMGTVWNDTLPMKPGEAGKLSHVDSCRTIACLDNEIIINELYLEMNEEELENVLH